MTTVALRLIPIAAPTGSRVVHELGAPSQDAEHPSHVARIAVGDSSSIAIEGYRDARGVECYFARPDVASRFSMTEDDPEGRSVAVEGGARMLLDVEARISAVFCGDYDGDSRSDVVLQLETGACLLVHVDEVAEEFRPEELPRESTQDASTSVPRVDPPALHRQEPIEPPSHPPPNGGDIPPSLGITRPGEREEGLRPISPSAKEGI
jgi:hypothetical protein